MRRLCRSAAAGRKWRSNRNRRKPPRKGKRARKPCRLTKKARRGAEVKASSRKNTNRLIAAMLVVVVLATGFWVLLLSPKRSEADKLTLRAQSLESSLALHTGEVDGAEAAKKSFAEDYAHLVVLGKAVPAEAET